MTDALLLTKWASNGETCNLSVNLNRLVEQNSVCHDIWTWSWAWVPCLFNFLSWGPAVWAWTWYDWPLGASTAHGVQCLLSRREICSAGRCTMLPVSGIWISSCHPVKYLIGTMNLCDCKYPNRFGVWVETVMAAMVALRTHSYRGWVRTTLYALQTPLFLSHSYQSHRRTWIKWVWIKKRPKWSQESAKLTDRAPSNLQ